MAGLIVDLWPEAVGATRAMELHGTISLATGCQITQISDLIQPDSCFVLILEEEI